VREAPCIVKDQQAGFVTQELLNVSAASSGMTTYSRGGLAGQLEAPQVARILFNEWRRQAGSADARGESAADRTSVLSSTPGKGLAVNGSMQYQYYYPG